MQNGGRHGARLCWRKHGNRFISACCLLALVALSACAGAAPAVVTTAISSPTTAQSTATVSTSTSASTAAVQASGAAARVPGTFFIEPDDGVGIIVDAINHSQKSIDMTMYLLTDREVIAALKGSVTRHVRVRALLEQHPVGNGPGNQGIYDDLHAAGVDVKWSNPAFRLTHEKSLVLDGSSALITTANLTFSSVTSNREYGMLDTDPADAAADEAIFQADWDRTAVSPSRADLVVAPNNARQKLTALIAGAKQTLLAEQEEIEDPGIEDAIVAAAKRGVMVRVIAPTPGTGADYNAAGVQRISAGGANVHRLAKPYPHAKMFLADGQTLYVGSANVSTSSLDFTRELGLIMSNPDAIQRVEQTFEKDWNASARV
ncbi:MAG: phospholipase D-like domain-containing protein [Chloroflexota bacterium]